MLAIAEDGSAITDAFDFIHAVADIKDDLACGAQLSNTVEQSVGFTRREGAGWFIECDNACIPNQRLGDLNHLPLCEREVTQACFWTNIQLDPREGCLCVRCQLCFVNNPRLRWKCTKKEVFGYRELINKMKLLINNANA